MVQPKYTLKYERFTWLDLGKVMFIVRRKEKNDPNLKMSKTSNAKKNSATKTKYSKYCKN